MLNNLILTNLTVNIASFLCFLNSPSDQT